MIKNIQLTSQLAGVVEPTGIKPDQDNFYREVSTAMPLHQGFQAAIWIGMLMITKT